MKKQTVVNSVLITAPGHIEVQMCKQVVEDDGSVVSSDYHRTAIECGGDVSAQMNNINEHLAQMGWPAVSDEEIQSIVDHAQVAWTPMKRNAWLQAKAVALAQQMETASKADVAQ